VSTFRTRNDKGAGKRRTVKWALTSERRKW
jgi:hypothetical protein